MNNYHIQNRIFNRHQLEEWAWAQLQTPREDWERSHLLFILEWLGKSDHIGVKTSGSTGVPKTIQLSKEQMKNSARLTAGYFKLTSETKALLLLPSTFIAGKMMIVRSLEHGWDLTWAEPSIKPCFEWKESFGFVALTPVQASWMLDNTPEAFRFIENIIIGGGNVSDALARRLKQCGSRVAITYGMTETISHVAIRELDNEADQNSFFALPGVTFTVDNRECLVIKAEHLGDEEIITNDLVHLISPVQFEFLGRIDHVINSGGVKVFPEALEEEIAEWIGRNHLIVGERDDVLGEKIILQIEGAEWPEIELSELWEKLKERKTTARFIKEIRFVPEFEFTSSGKLIRKNYFQ